MDERFRFLGKLVLAFENLQEKTEFLEVTADGLPNGYVPYDFEDWIEDYPFEFVYKGTTFNIKVIYNSKSEEICEILKIIITDEKGFKAEKGFKMNERTSTMEKFWQNILKMIESSGLNLPSDYYFTKWFDQQDIGMLKQWTYRKEERYAFKKELYKEITKHVSPKEIEEELGRRFEGFAKSDESWIHFKEKTAVEMHGFLNNKLFILCSNANKDIFVIANEKDALQKYEEEIILRVKELIH